MFSYKIENIYYSPMPNGNRGDDTSANLRVPHPDIASKNGCYRSFHCHPDPPYMTRIHHIRRS